MRRIGWFTVGFFYFFVVKQNFLAITESPLAATQCMICGSALTPQMNFTLFILSGLIFSALIALSCVLTWGYPSSQNSSDQNSSNKIRKLALAGLGGLLIQVLLGSLVRQTHAGNACPNFPFCVDGFLPYPLTTESILAFGHRWWGILLLGHFFHLALTAARHSPDMAQPTRRVFALSVAQVFFGDWNCFKWSGCTFTISAFGNRLRTLGTFILCSDSIRRSSLVLVTLYFFLTCATIGIDVLSRRDSSYHEFQ